MANSEKSGPDTERDFSPSEIVRMFEAACEIDFPTDTERHFRIALMKRIGDRLKLRELRNIAITGPKEPSPSRPATPSGKK